MQKSLTQDVSATILSDASQIADVIEKGVNTFMEAVPTLSKALDEVAKIHPFITGKPHPFNKRIEVS